MSEQTKYSAALRVAPNQSKKPSNVAALRSRPTHSRRLRVAELDALLDDLDLRSI